MAGFFLIFWILIAVLSILSSGAIYYALSEIWIPVVPLVAAALCYSLHLLISSSNKSDKNTFLTDADRDALVRLWKFLSPVLVMLLAGVCLVAQYVVSTFGGSIWEAQELREAFYSNMELVGGAYFLWLSWLVFALTVYFVIMAAAHDAVTGRLISVYAILAFLVTFVWSLSTGARMGPLSALILYFSVWFSGYRGRVDAIKLVFAGLVLAAPFIVQVLNRLEGRDDSSLGNLTVLKYFVGPVFAFDQIILDKSITMAASELGRPGVSIIGLDTIFVSGFLRGVLGLDVQSALASSSGILHYGVWIGSDVVMNAHYVAGSKWFIDFGVSGYIVFYLVFAFVVVVWERAHAKGSLAAFLLSGFLALQIVYSSREFIFDSPSYLFALMMVLATAWFISRSRCRVTKL